MRKILFVFFIVLMLFTICVTAWAGGGKEKQIDLNGIYYGVIPAADCPGIAVVFILNNEGRYKITYQYIDRGDEVFTYNGNFSYDEKTKIITLGGKGPMPYYKAGKNSITQLDIEGKEISGLLAENYRLSKVKFPDS